MVAESVSSVQEYLSNLTPTNALAIGLVSALGFLMIWYLMSGSRMNLTFWHFGFFAVAGFLIGTALQAYGKIWDWVSMGLHFENTGATLFVVGMISMLAVMAWNLVASNGKTLVR